MPDTDIQLPSAPDTIDGRYRLLEEIGRGGMATVYRARDLVLDRQVAVKVLHDHLAADPALTDRFRREAQAAAALSHPNVVAVFDWGKSDERAYMVLEYVPGMSLRDVLKVRGRVAPDEALALIGPAAAGIAAAHLAGLVHRDVKPENILLGEDGAVKVTDFGLARATASSTQTFGADVIVGSPHYLAPEIVNGEAITAAADVYALGIVLFECLTGRPPFEGDTPMATALQHANRQVPAPSSAVPDIPGPVDEIVRRATAVQPADRFEDAARFAFAFSEAVPGGAAPVDLRDGTRDTIILPVDATDTLIGLLPEGPKDPRRRKTKAPRTVEQKRRRRRVVVAVLAALLAAGGYVTWDQVIAPVTVLPTVVTEPEDAAVATLEEAGFQVEVVGTAFDLEVPAGHVLAQSPTDEARLGSTVELMISDGPRQHVVPGLVGLEEQEARAKITGLNVTPEVVYDYSEDFAAGVVISASPPPGEKVDEGGVVTLTVSQGRQPIEVPTVTSLPSDGAVAELEALGLDPVILEEVFHDDVEEGAIVSQSPGPGEILFRGDRVELVVSKGSEPFAMPDLRGKKEAEARSFLRQRGIEVQVEYVDTIFFPRAGNVDEQDPSPGTPVRRGDTVTLYVWR